MTTTETRANTKISFDTFTLNALRPPEAGPNGQVVQKDFWCDQTPKFGLRISSTGAYTWILLARVMRNGKPTVSRMSIGRCYPDPKKWGGMSLSDARAKANELLKLIESGIDPNAEKQACIAAHIEAKAKEAERVANEKTLAQVIELYLNSAKFKKLRPSTQGQYKSMLREGGAFDVLRGRPIANITRRDVAAALAAIQARGLTTAANRSLTVLGCVMHYAIATLCIMEMEHSPCDHIDMPVHEDARERHLFGDRQTPSEIATALRAFDQIGTFGAIPKMLLLTGARLREICDMQESELVDLDGAEPLWILPAARSKNKIENVVPLAPLAVKIIKAMPRRAGSPFIFQAWGARGFEGTGYLKARIDKEVAKIIAADPAAYAGQFATPWRLHDLRRTFRTGLSELGVPADIAERLIGHKLAGVLGVYDRAQNLKAKREAVLLWENHVLKLIDPPNGQNVVYLKAA